MTWATVTPRERLVLLGGAAIVTSIVLLGRGLPLVARWNERMIVEASHDLRRVRALESIATQRKTIRDSLEWYRGELDALNERSFSAPTPAMAGVDLAGLLEHIARQEHVEVSSTVVLADSAFTGPRAVISVRVFAVGDSRGLFALLRALESSALGLEVSELTISQPEPAAEAREPEALRIELLVTARALAAREGAAR